MAGSTIDLAAAAELVFVTERFEVASGRATGRECGRAASCARSCGCTRRAAAAGSSRSSITSRGAVEDGEPWVAAFPWGGGRLEAERAELEVGRDVLVELPVSGAPRRKPRPAPARTPGELARAREQLATSQAEAGAALIIIAVFSGFARGDLVMVQQMGFSVAVALLVDATIVRLVLVPAAMDLLGDRNWYLPSWLRWLPDIHVEGDAPSGSGVP